MNVPNINGKTVNNLINSTVDSAKSSEFEEKLKAAYNENDKKKLKKSCQQFEAIFMNIVFKEMKATVPKSDLIENSQGKEMFQSMLDDEMMNKVTEKNGIGIANDLYKFMSKQIDKQYKVDKTKE